MTPQIGHTKTSKGIRYNYLYFKGVRHFDSFVKYEVQELTASNRKVWESVRNNTHHLIDRGSDWLGSPAPKSIEELESHSTFSGMHLVEEVRRKFQQQFDPYLKHLEENIMPKPRMAYNDRGLGMFSFDRAAMGLFRHPRIKTETPIQLLTSQLKVELGKGDIQTSIKEVYCHFENRNTAQPTVKLYLGAGANANVKSHELLYVGLGCAELVDFLEQRGIGVEVNVLLGTHFDQVVNIGVIKVKAFEDRLDKNQLLLLSSDPRYFRYKGFKGLIALTNHFSLTIPKGLGRLKKNLFTHFHALLEDSGFVFEQSYSLDAVSKEVTRIIETYEARKRQNAA